MSYNILNSKFGAMQSHLQNPKLTMISMQGQLIKPYKHTRYG